jgi:4-aminobutyrate aminotransferase-like enzyme
MRAGGGGVLASLRRMALRLRTKTTDLKRRDAKVVGRSSPATDLAVVRCAGSEVWDVRGRRYIDFVMGWCCGNLGWGAAGIRERLARFDGPDYAPPTFLYEPWIELAELLAELAPGDLRRSFRATGGTEAIECALQIAMAYTGRHKLVSIEGAYHGNSFGARTVGAIDDAPAHLAGARRLKPPLDAKAVGRLETLLQHDDVAAFVMEPVIMNLGVCVPAREFIEGASDLCRRHGTLFVADEIACGFGRTGRLFACEHFGLEPDILCLAKAITNGHAPLGVAITTDEIADALDLDFYSTYGWHPVAVEAALATVEHHRDHRDELQRNVAARSAQLSARLAHLSPNVLGLAASFACDDAEKIGERCREHGLLVSAEDDRISLFPALTVDEGTVEEGIDVLLRSL